MRAMHVIVNILKLLGLQDYKKREGFPDSRSGNKHATTNKDNTIHGLIDQRDQGF
jgi:hypothetical protein